MATKASPQSSQGGVDPRNQLNELTGKEWIQETSTVWRQKGLGADHPETHFERLHPAPFSFQDVARLIRFFTKPGMLVLDPFAGVASSLKAAALEERRGIGIELSPHWAELGRERLAAEVPDDSQQDIWCMDVREALPQLADDSVDFIVTSPPYWSILNKRPDHKTLNGRIANGLQQSYSEDADDLGNLASYDEFLLTLTEIFAALAEKLARGRYCAVIVSDFKHADRFYPFHSDLYGKLDGRGLELQGVTVLHQPHKSLYPYGYPFAYVPNIHHQYILLFRRPRAAKAPRKQRSGVVRVPDDVERQLEALRRLPYREGEMSARNWGHRRHSLCSFPSKMKPALASTLVDLFSLSDSVVLDPFGGSGTVPFEAALQGRVAISNDLSPLAHAIGSAKLKPPSAGECNHLLAELEATLKEGAADADLSAMEPEIHEFFHRRTAREIIVARQCLSSRSDNFHSDDAALFVTACLAHILHGNRPYALSRRSHNIIPIPPKGRKEYKPLMASLRAKCERVLGSPLPPTFRAGKTLRGDATELALADASVDVVVTSPPFLGSTHFLRQNRLRNWLLGWSYAEQERRRDDFLEHKPNLSPYTAIVAEMRRVIRPGGLAVFHLGIVKNENMAELLAPYFLDAGFAELGTVWEGTGDLETHGRSDRGSTHTHGMVVLRRE